MYEDDWHSSEYGGFYPKHQWKRVLTAGGELLAKFISGSRIFQGDSLSPLYFVISLIPLTLVLRKVQAGCLAYIVPDILHKAEYFGMFLVGGLAPRIQPFRAITISVHSIMSSIMASGADFEETLL